MSKSKKVLVKYDERIVPNNLKVNPFFIEVLSLDADKMFEYNLSALKSFGYTDINSYWHPTDGYIFARGTLPVCLCAHMDKVPYYHSIKKIGRACSLGKKDKITDTYLFSKQGIGGDDRCGVYAILYMLKLGHRPSVLFCMGEEIGCRGSHKFVDDHSKDFLSDVNAFIQIDRRGNHDCVRYSDCNDALTKAICEYDFSYAFGSCTDISVLMPHFGISGVNLSSGYYNEHHADKEYVSVKDVNYLLKRLDKILSSSIFATRYEYKSSYSYYRRPLNDSSTYKQMSLFKNMPYIEDDGLAVCDCCGEYVYEYDLHDVQCDEFDMICDDCADDIFIPQGYVRCPACGSICKPSAAPNDAKFVRDFCEFCGCLLGDNDD